MDIMTNKRTTMIWIDKKVHQDLKILSAKNTMSMKSLIERLVNDLKEGNHKKQIA